MTTTSPPVPAVVAWSRAAGGPTVMISTVGSVRGDRQDLMASTDSDYLNR